MDGAGGEIVKGIGHGGLEPLHHAVLHQHGGGLEADGDDGTFRLEVGAEGVHGGGAIRGSGIGGQQRIGLRVGPLAVVCPAAGTHQSSEIPVCREIDLPVIEVELPRGQRGGVLRPGQGLYLDVQIKGGELLGDGSGGGDSTEPAGTTVSRADAIKYQNSKIASLKLDIQESDIKISQLEKKANKKLVSSKLDGIVGLIKFFSHL